MKWEPKDVIACLIVVGGLLLLGLGINFWVGGALLGLIATYYGIDLTPQIKLGRNNKSKKGGDE
ncbi:hypothetical protein ES708_21619 [subsurface metagenome]